KTEGSLSSFSKCLFFAPVSNCLGTLRAQSTSVQICCQTRKRHCRGVESCFRLPFSRNFLWTPIGPHSAYGETGETVIKTVLRGDARHHFATCACGSSRGRQWAADKMSRKWVRTASGPQYSRS